MISILESAFVSVNAVKENLFAPMPQDKKESVVPMTNDMESLIYRLSRIAADIESDLNQIRERI